MHCLEDEIGLDARFWTMNQAFSPSRELVLLLSKTFFSVVVDSDKFDLSETLFS